MTWWKANTPMHRTGLSYEGIYYVIRSEKTADGWRWGASNASSASDVIWSTTSFDAEEDAIVAGLRAVITGSVYWGQAA